MQRFRNITIHCENENSALEMLQTIASACNQPPFVYEKDNDRLLKDKTVRIISTHAYTTEAVIIVIASGSNVKVINIIPNKRSVFRIYKNEYNTIMEYFKTEVIDEIIGDKVVDFPEAEYSMETVIPKSYKKLNNWATCPGAPNAPFSHQNDLNCWFDFVIALFSNNERDKLSSSDLEQWLEEKGWDEEVIEETILHYEHDTDLIAYFYKIYGFGNRILNFTKPYTLMKAESEGGVHVIVVPQQDTTISVSEHEKTNV
jgi:hypothetical protein